MSVLVRLWSLRSWLLSLSWSRPGRGRLARTRTNRRQPAGTSGAAVADATLAGAGDHDIPALPEPLQLEVATGPKTPQADATMTPDTAGPDSATDVATSAPAVSTEPTEVEPPTDPGGGG